MDIDPPPTVNIDKSSKSKSIIIGLLVAIVALILGAAGGYMIGQAQKEKAIEDAKAAAKVEALDQAKADADKKESPPADPAEKAPAKTATETTCNADELSLSTSVEGGAAGTVAYNLVLTNIGKRTCVLGGFPGVSLVNDNGNQIGSPATRATNYTEKKLTLAPDAKVKALASISNSGNFPEGECKEGATKFRVYPPNDTGYLSVATTVDSWCPGFAVSPVLDM